jgi:hypothetical protein
MVPQMRVGVLSPTLTIALEDTGNSQFLVLGLLWASHKGDSVQLHTTPEDLLMPHEPRPAPPLGHGYVATAIAGKEELIADVRPTPQKWQRALAALR